jgi:transmembrane sensor
MSANDPSVRELIGRQAADWFVANRGGLSPAERDGFSSWLRASPVHVEEYLRIAAVARDLRQACARPETSVDALVARARSEKSAPSEPLWQRIGSALGAGSARVWQTAAVATAAFAAVYLGWHALRAPVPVPHMLAPAPVLALHFQTRHGEQQTHRLADNSILHLNTDSAVTVRYSKTERAVMLTSGEAEFEVVHDPTRAFRVNAGAAQVVDLGTQFDVRLALTSTLVTVLEGRVAVALSPTPRAAGSLTPPPPAQFVQLGAGQQISVTKGEWPAKPTSVQARRTTAWLHRQIIFEHERLGEVADEFNRYASTPVEITAPALRGLEISGVFATDDPLPFIAFLRSLDGVRVEVTTSRILVLQN